MSCLFCQLAFLARSDDGEHALDAALAGAYQAGKSVAAGGVLRSPICARHATRVAAQELRAADALFEREEKARGGH